MIRYKWPKNGAALKNVDTEREKDREVEVHWYYYVNDFDRLEPRQRLSNSKHNEASTVLVKRSYWW